MVDVKLLIDFKDLKLSKNDLCKLIGFNLISLSIENPVIVNAVDVVNMLISYKNGKLTTQELLNWVNVVWFTELYSYNDEECDSIASVMNHLEELEETSIVLSDADIDKLILALKSNQEV